MVPRNKLPVPRFEDFAPGMFYERRWQESVFPSLEKHLNCVRNHSVYIFKMIKAETTFLERSGLYEAVMPTAEVGESWWVSAQMNKK